MALAIAVVVALITVISVAIVVLKVWWMPLDISTHGPAIDHQMNLTLIVTGIIFILAQLGLAWFVWKYRDRGDGRKAIYSHGHGMLEATWTTMAAILFIGLNLMGYRMWAEMYFRGAPPDALRVQVLGQQFAWYFRYPGPDGQFGPTHVEKVNDASGNFYGIDRERDPGSKDDIVTATLAVPVNRPVELVLLAKDVTHDFYVRELRIQQDMVPGMQIPVHFTATKTGRFEIACNQLCGLGHYKMRAFLEVMSEEDFQKWLQNMAAQQ